MTRGTAATYWANTATAHFDSMTSPLWQGDGNETAANDRTGPGHADQRQDQDQAGDMLRAPAPRRYRMQPLSPSQQIIDAIAACSPGNQPAGQPVADSSGSRSVRPKVGTSV